MRFESINIFGVYVAPMAVFMLAAWLLLLPLRRAADRFGLLHYFWHPALFVLSVYLILLSSIVLFAAWWGR